MPARPPSPAPPCPSSPPEGADAKVEFAELKSDGTVESTALAAPEVRYGPAFDAWSSERSAGIRSGSAISPKGALTLAAYYAAINVLSTDLACLPIKMFRKRKSGGRDEVTDDPRSDLLAVSPDGETTSMRMRQALLGHTFGWGNGYAEIEFDAGQVSGLYLLDPTTEVSRRSQDKKLYYRLPDGSTRPPYKVLHFAGFGYDGLCGYSPAKLMQQTIRLGKNAETFGANFFDNGITASGHFEAPHRYDKDAADAFRAEMNAMHAGAGNAHRFMVLWNGWKWTKTTIPPNEAQFLESRAFQVLEVARMFRLPPHKIGDYSQSHLANIEEANIDYMVTVLMPWCESMDQEYNRKLFTREERLRGYYVEHQMEAFLRGDSASRGSWYQTMFGLGLYTINTIAAKENMNPIGQFGDERFLTVQAQPLSTLLNPPAPPPKAAANDQPAEAPAPVAVNGQRFKPVPNGVATLIHGGDGRYNPHHGADGKFSGGSGSLAGHAPATATTGSKIAVEEGPPQTAADRKHADAAEAAGKTAIRVDDKPDLAIDRQADHTDYYVGGKQDARVESFTDKDDFGKSYKGWQVTSYDNDTGAPLPAPDRYNSRRTAESVAKDQARGRQRDESATARVTTKDPEGFVAKGQTAHGVGGAADPTNNNWTTTYRAFKTPEG
jgi:HK97 family phage portal protein